MQGHAYLSGVLRQLTGRAVVETEEESCPKSLEKESVKFSDLWKRERTPSPEVRVSLRSCRY